MAYAIRETCSCGAEFVMAGPLSALVDSAAERWRRTHQHPAPDAVPSGEATDGTTPTKEA